MQNSNPLRGKQLESHLPCGECGSSDAATLYEKLEHPYNQYVKCYSCGAVVDTDQGTVHVKKQKEYNPVTNTESVSSLPYEYLPEDNFWGRGITEETFKNFGVRTNEQGTRLVFPIYDINLNFVGYQERTEDKQFFLKGEIQKGSLFGIDVAKKRKGRSITVLEGFPDLMAHDQMMGGKYAAVSIRTGAQAAKSMSIDDIKFLETFEEVVICFDSDEAGRKAAKEFAKSFTNVKVSIVDLSLKDANEYLKEGRETEYVNTWWNKRKPYRPDGLMYSSETESFITEYDPKPEAYYPYEGLNKLLWGIYFPSLMVVTAGSGVGKTQFVKDLLLSLHKSTSEKIGTLFLEEGVKQTIYQFLSIDLSKNINNPFIYEETDKGVIHKAWERIFKSDRWMLWNHFGSSNLDRVCEQVRYMGHNFGSRIIVLDHVSIVVSSQENGDERKALDEIMTKLRKLAEELSICIILVSHLKRPNGSDSHEEGGVTSLAQLRGSAGIGQLADVVLGLERNGQHEDEFMRDLVTVRVLKSRKTGRTGPACQLLYNSNECSFTEIDQTKINEHIEELKAKKQTKSLEPDKPIMDSSPLGGVL